MDVGKNILLILLFLERQLRKTKNILTIVRLVKGEDIVRLWGSGRDNWGVGRRERGRGGRGWLVLDLILISILIFVLVGGETKRGKRK